jgi:hypothetical protein
MRVLAWYYNRAAYSSTKTSSRLFFTAGRVTIMTSKAAAMRRPRDKGRVKKVV